MKPVLIDSIYNVFNFGKHRGETIKKVALIDPDYIEWLCKEVKDFNIYSETIDTLSEYCLSIFFNDPEAYLNESGNFTLSSWQYLKLGQKEVTIGYKDRIQMIAELNSNTTIPHISRNFARKVFNGEICKNNLKERILEDSSNDDDKFYDDDDDTISYEELRRLNNDAYEIDSNEFEGWYEPID